MPDLEKDATFTCPDCGAEWEEPMREGCKRPWHHADEWGWTRPLTDHEFEAFDGATGRACTRMVERDGYGEDCGLPPASHPRVLPPADGHTS